MLITEEDIDDAFDHIETIARLHFAKEQEGKAEAMLAYEEFLGMTSDASNALIRRIQKFVPEERKEAVGWIYIGVTLGLSAANKAIESD